MNVCICFALLITSPAVMSLRLSDVIDSSLEWVAMGTKSDLDDQKFRSTLDCCMDVVQTGKILLGEI